MALSNRDFLLVVLAFFLPPLTVLLKLGLGIEFLINILLTLLGAVPGNPTS
jgi:uncharacterized membrane protein YqaE (UPF0057 family)